MSYMMTEDEREQRAKIKAHHHAVRTAMHDAARESGWKHRYALLAWALVRGLPYRRCERDHHKQVRPDGSVFEHGLPDVSDLARALAPFCPEIAAPFCAEVRADMDPVGRFSWLRRGSATETRLKAWIADPAGAIPAPPPRPKKPYTGHGEASPEPLAAE